MRYAVGGEMGPDDPFTRREEEIPVTSNTIRTRGGVHRTGRQLGSDTVTRGVRIIVTPSYLPEHSDPLERRFVFAYRIRIANESDRWVKLLSRRWIIVDSQGERQEVVGEGVIGAQPELDPGQSFEYSSYCPLGTEWGTMEGEYTMRIDDDSTFQVAIGRFFLVAEEDIDPVR